MSPPKATEPTTSGRAMPWREVKAKSRQVDPTWDAPERVAHRSRMREEMPAEVSGTQLAELRRQADLTQVQLAAAA